MDKGKFIKSISLEILGVVAGLLTNLFYHEISGGTYKVQQIENDILVQEVNSNGVWQRIVLIISTFIIIWVALVCTIMVYRFVSSRMRYHKKKRFSCEMIVSTFMVAKHTFLEIQCAISEKSQQSIIGDSAFVLLYTSEIGGCVSDLHRVFCESSDRQKRIIRASFRTGGSCDFKERISPYEFFEVITICEILVDKIKSANSSDIFMNDQKQLMDKVNALKAVI